MLGQLISDTFLGPLRSREVVSSASILADHFVSLSRSSPRNVDQAIERALARAVLDLPQPLSFFKRARFAQAFMWQLVEQGVDRSVADEATKSLLLRLALKATAPRATHVAPKPDEEFHRGNRFFGANAFEDAIACYEREIELAPEHAGAVNNLGSALYKLGRYPEAKERFLQAIAIDPNLAEAHTNLGTLLRGAGGIAESELSFRRALKLNASDLDAAANLALTLILLGRLREARRRLEKVLKRDPLNLNAAFGMGQIAAMEGRFDTAEKIFTRILKKDPGMTAVWAALVRTRKMSAADAPLLARAEDRAQSVIAPLEEADLRFAIGKYADDVGDYDKAFRNYSRANELLKQGAEDYDRRSRTRFVDDLIAGYTREAVASAARDASDSTRPIFVVGMMRSGTSLVEQIIASHPGVVGAGELHFWSDVASRHEAMVRKGILDASIRRDLAQDYLNTLSAHSATAAHVVDKAPVNADHLGLIHSVFPRARIIYLHRDPIDTCLSIYFQQFSIAMNFTMDLSDLAHYYREHRRLFLHWRDTLPPGTLLEVPYSGLVADLAGWTRRILEHLGLDWDERCLDFHQTQRSVITASSWQVRQKIYGSSVKRWQHYERHIGPLLSLRDLDRD